MDKELSTHKEKYKTIYDHGCLNPDVHHRLVVELDKYTALANVPARFIYQSATNFCQPFEIEWAKKIASHIEDGDYGLMFNDKCKDLDDRLYGLAGLLIRNFVDARVYTVQYILDMLADSDEIEGRVIIIPNFFLMKSMGGSLPAWKISSLLGFLMERYSKGLPTIVYIQQLNHMGEEYGKAFKDHIENHFTVVPK